jgi:hypothetical protein
VAVHFKGSGFYNTDYGTKRRAREMEKSASEGADKTAAKDKKDSTASAGKDGGSGGGGKGGGGKGGGGASSSTSTGDG